MGNGVRETFVLTTKSETGSTTVRSPSLRFHCKEYLNCQYISIGSGFVSPDISFHRQNMVTDRVVFSAFVEVFKKISTRPAGWYLVYEDDAILFESMNYLSPPFTFPTDAVMINIQKEGGFYWCDNPSTVSPMLSEAKKCSGGFGLVGIYISQRGAQILFEHFMKPMAFIEPVDVIIYNKFRQNVYQSRAKIKGNVYVDHRELNRTGNFQDFTGKKQTLSKKLTQDRCVRVYSTLVCFESHRLILQRNVWRTNQYVNYSSYDYGHLGVYQIGICNNNAADLFQDCDISAEAAFNLLHKFNCISYDF